MIISLVLVAHVCVQACMDVQGVLSNHYLCASELCFLDIPSA